MLLLKQPQNNEISFAVPNTAIRIIGNFFLVDADISIFTSAQVAAYKVKVVTDATLIADLEKLTYDVWDGLVRKMTTGPSPLSEPLFGDELESHLRGIKYIAKLNAAMAFNDQYQALVNTDTDLEQSTWSQQLAEATAYTANSSASTPLLSALAAVKGITVAQYAEKVMSASAAYNTAVATLMTNLKTATAEINAAADAATVKSLGWI